MGNLGQNLLQTLKHVEHADLSKYWLNRNGTFTAKTSWLGRVIRWIQNWFCDKTLNDMWYVFQKTMNAYTSALEVHKEIQLSESDKQKRRDINDKLRFPANHLNIAVEFLLSRKDKLQSWLEKHPEKITFIKNGVAALSKGHESIKEENEDNPISPLLSVLLDHVVSLYIPPLVKANLGLIPPPLKFAITPESDPQKYACLDITKLATAFEQTNVPHISPDKKAELEAKLREMLQKVNARDSTVFGVKESICKLYYDQMHLYVKNILLELSENSKIPQEKRNQVLLELALASKECTMRWMEESKRQYRNLNLLTMNLGEAKVLEHLMALKEDMVLEMFYNLKVNTLEFHILDTFRKMHAKELGLDDSTIDLDVFTYTISKSSEHAFATSSKRCFLSHYYIPERIVKGLVLRINRELSEKGEYDPSYAVLMIDRLETKFPSREDATQYVLEFFFTHGGGKINANGVVFLLQIAKILAS